MSEVHPASLSAPESGATDTQSGGVGWGGVLPRPTQSSESPDDLCYSQEAGDHFHKLLFYNHFVKTPIFSCGEGEVASTALV